MARSAPLKRLYSRIEQVKDEITEYNENTNTGMTVIQETACRWKFIYGTVHSGIK